MQTNNEISPTGAKNFTDLAPRLSVEYDVPSKKHGFYDFVVSLNVGDFEGRCCLKQIDIGLLETHCRLDHELCGQGYGTMMYSAAIRFAKGMGFRICSSPHRKMTVGARRVWKSSGLNRSFTIVRGWERFFVV